MGAWQRQLQSSYMIRAVTQRKIRRAENTHHHHQNYRNNHIDTSRHSTQISLQRLLKSKLTRVRILPPLIFGLPSCASSPLLQEQFDPSSSRLQVMQKRHADAQERPL